MTNPINTTIQGIVNRIAKCKPFTPDKPFRTILTQELITLETRVREELREKVKKLKVAPHLPEGMKPNLGEEVRNNALDDVLELLTTKTGGV
jgi:hypothetical protein